MSKWAVLVLVVLACTAARGKRNHKVHVPLQVDKVKAVLEDTVKLLGHDGTPAQLRASANKFNLYAQEAIVVFNKAFDELPSDPGFRSQMAAVIKRVEEYAYHLAKNTNGDAARLKSAVEATLKNFAELATPGRGLFEQPENDRHQSALNSIAESYNLGSFNMALMYVTMKHGGKTNAEVGAVLETNAETAQTFLKSINSTNGQLFGELARLTRHVGHLFERIVEDVERWAFVYNSTTPQHQELDRVSRALWKVAQELRNSTKFAVAVFELRHGLEEFLRNSCAHMKKLIQTKAEELTRKNDLYKGALLEYWTLLVMFNIKIEVIVSILNK